MSKVNSKGKIEYSINNVNTMNNDMVPIVTVDDFENIDWDIIGSGLPVLPLRNSVLFPRVVMPIVIGRKKSVKLVKSIFKGTKMVGTLCQIDSNVEAPSPIDLYIHGTIARVLQVFEMPDGTTSVIIQGLERFTTDKILTENPFLEVAFSRIPEIVPDKADFEFEAILASLREIFLRIIELLHLPDEASIAIKSIDNPVFLVNYICSNGELTVSQKQQLLEITEIKKRAILLLEFLTYELQKLELKDDIQYKVRQEIDKQQREYFLNQQIKTIQNELGGDPVKLETEELLKKSRKKKWGKEVAAVFEKELARLQRINQASPEYSIQLNYIQVLLDLPWNEYTKDNFDLNRAKDILDNEHYGLDKMKERILEYLAVLKLKGDLKSPILCLYGPPGVGKTSLGKSIAKALNRKYVRMSLGGLHDEAEIRGHRKTYIGAMPGRIIQSIKKAKAANPVFILDEIDKVGNDFRGDPSSALLEVLDPEQNLTFYDNFLELEFDLSKVMFIATANSLANIKPALLDRMEILNITGYVVEEKIHIAHNHLFPKQLKEHGVKKSQFKISDDVLSFIIQNYTSESGVRELEKVLASVTRKIARKIAFNETYTVNATTEFITELLGIPRYQRDKYSQNDKAGVVTGLAWTATGGEILTIESSLSKGNGKLTLTGNLGNVMKESAVIALEFLKSNFNLLKIDSRIFNSWNIHLHIPEGAIPKDGPSAGITMTSAMASAFTQRKTRPFTAMTGEITLTGKVLPIGGIKEKILAAKRAGITHIVIPEDNRKDILEIKPLYYQGVEFFYVKDIMEVLKFILLDEQVDNALKLIPSKKKNQSDLLY